MRSKKHPLCNACKKDLLDAEASELYYDYRENTWWSLSEEDAAARDAEDRVQAPPQQQQRQQQQQQPATHQARGQSSSSGATHIALCLGDTVLVRDEQGQVFQGELCGVIDGSLPITLAMSSVKLVERTRAASRSRSRDREL